MTGIKYSLRIGVLLITIFSQPLYAQWTKVDGSHGGYTQCLASHGSDLYAGTAAGLFRSSDSGAHWMLVNSDIPEKITCVAFIGDTMFAGTNGAGVYRLTDGTTATAFNSGIKNVAASLTVDALLATPDGLGGTNIIANTKGGIYMLPDHGMTWTLADSTASIDAFGSLVAEPNGTGGSYLYASMSANGCRFSTDNGATWTARNNGLPHSLHQPVSSLAVTDSGVFAASGGVYRSTDHGLNWAITGSLPTMNIWSGPVANASFLSAMGETIYAANPYGVYRSTNNGGEWILTSGAGLPRQDLNYEMTIPPAITSIATQGSMVFVGNTIGLFGSTDEGASWNTYTNGLDVTTVGPIAVSGQNVYAVERNGYSITHSPDNGSSWLPWSTDPASYHYTALAANDSFAVVQTDFPPPISLGYEYGRILRYKVGGTRWDSVGAQPLGALAVNNDYIFSCGEYGASTAGVERCSLDSTNWSAFRNGMVGMPGITFLAAEGSTVYASRGGPVAMGILRSADNGMNWSLADNGFESETYVTAFALNGSTAFAGTGAPPNSSGFLLLGVYRTLDDGAHWIQVSQDLTDTQIVALALHGIIIFAGTSNNGVFVSTNNGDNWTQFNDGLPRLGIASLGINDTYVYAGILGGLYRRPLADVVTAVGDPPKSVPTRFGLSQNYPNPFNPSTTIVYQVAGSREYGVGSREKTDALGHVKLAVYDLLGREVAVLVDGYQTPGEHRVTFDARMLASGVYFYRLSAGGQIAVKRMALVR